MHHTRHCSKYIRPLGIFKCKPLFSYGKLFWRNLASWVFVSFGLEFRLSLQIALHTPKSKIIETLVLFFFFFLETWWRTDPIISNIFANKPQVIDRFQCNWRRYWPIAWRELVLATRTAEVAVWKKSGGALIWIPLMIEVWRSLKWCFRIHCSAQRCTVLLCFYWNSHVVQSCCVWLVLYLGAVNPAYFKDLLMARGRQTDSWKSDSGHFGQKILHFLGNLLSLQDPVTYDTLSQMNTFRNLLCSRSPGSFQIQ